MTTNPLFIDALGYHEALRRLGFLPDDIYMLIGTGYVQVVLKQESREFVINVGQSDLPDAELKSTWTTAIEEWNAGTDAERDVIWTLTKNRMSLLSFAIALKNKGFLLPVETMLRR